MARGTREATHSMPISDCDVQSDPGRHRARQERSPIGKADLLLAPLRTSPASETPWSETRVTKTMWPPMPGTRRLRSVHGAALVCVRYRHDRDGHYRYTTVELMIDHAPVRHRDDDRVWLAVRVPKSDITMRARIVAAGGKWQHASATWLLTRKAAIALRLERHVVATPPTEPKRSRRR